MNTAEIYRAFGQLKPEEQQHILDWLDRLLADPACTCDIEQYLAQQLTKV